MESTPRIVENGLVVWDEMFEERRVELPSDLAQCPDIFINVYFTTTVAKTEQRLGYIRLDLEDVVGFNHAPAFETLTRDPLDPKIAAVPGFLEYRLDFGKESNLPRTPSRAHHASSHAQIRAARPHLPGPQPALDG